MKVLVLVAIAFCLTACATTHRAPTASTVTRTAAPAPMPGNTLSGLNSEPGIAVSGGVVGQVSVGNTGR